MSRKSNTLEHVTASLARWQSRLRRAANMVGKLEGQKKRIEKAAAKPKPEPLAVQMLREIIEPVAEVVQPVAGDDLTIPAFLQRKRLDPVAAQIVAEHADTKRRKAAGRNARQKAARSGETKRMPLTGKAALAAIRDAGAKTG